MRPPTRAATERTPRVMDSWIPVSATFTVRSPGHQGQRPISSSCCPLGRRPTSCRRRRRRSARRRNVNGVVDGNRVRGSHHSPTVGPTPTLPNPSSCPTGEETVVFWRKCDVPLSLFTGRERASVWRVRGRGFVFALRGRRAFRPLFGGRSGRCCSCSGRRRRDRGGRCSGRRARRVPRL